ncbi:MAG: hypothetical protein RL757_2574 [Bacteroidota bacterium]
MIKRTTIKHHQKDFIFLFLLLCAFAAQGWSQTAATLEQAAMQTEEPRQKMNFLYQAAEKYLPSNAKKASDLAHAAYLKAEELGDKVMMSRTAYLNAEGYARQNDYSNAKIRYSRAKEPAIVVNDLDLAVKCLNKMSEMSRKLGNTKEATLYAAQATELKKGKTSGNPNTGRNGGTGSAATQPSEAAQRPTPSNPAEMEALRRQFQKERDQLIAERQRLANDIYTLQRDREQLSTGLAQSKQQTQQLTNENQQTQQLMTQQNQQLATLSTEKDQATRFLQIKQQMLEAVRNDAVLDSIANAQIQQEQTYALQKANHFKNVLFVVLGFALVIVGLIYRRFLENKKQKSILEEKNKVIEDERERSDELLLNILPKAIADELKATGKASAQRYEKATVLFTDFRNFTKISETLSPEQIVNELDTYFKAFDFIISQYRIEKIKTIGDAYMCACGLADGQTSPIPMVRAAVEMQQYINEVRTEKQRRNEPYFELKIGIHTGTVVAGVVGVNKFAYDIWGDTVNIASRMQDNCEPNKINVSEATYWDIKYKFKCIYRGKIHAKNKGEIDMYYVDNEIV